MALSESVRKVRRGAWILAAMLLTFPGHAAVPLSEVPCEKGSTTACTLRGCNQVVPTSTAAIGQLIKSAVDSHYRGTAPNAEVTRHVPYARPVCNPAKGELQKNHLGGSCGKLSEVTPSGLSASPRSAEASYFRGAWVQTLEHSRQKVSAEIAGGTLGVSQACWAVAKNYREQLDRWRKLSHEAESSGKCSTPVDCGKRANRGEVSCRVRAGRRNLESAFPLVAQCEVATRAQSLFLNAYFTPTGSSRFQARLQAEVVKPCKAECKPKCASASNAAACASKCATQCWQRRYPDFFRKDLLALFP